MYSKVKSQRLYEQITEQIQESILEGILRPGDKLASERELAEQFGVSRTVVREAVKALRQKGLVEIQIGRGTYVTDGLSTMSEVMRDSLSWIVQVGLENGMTNLVQVREILEPSIAEVAAAQAGFEEIKSMQEAIEIMDGAMNDADVYVAADLEFHLALAHATKNPLVPLLIDPIVDLLQEQRKLIFRVEDGPQRGQFHHKQILETMIQHNPGAARQAMIAHLEQVRIDSGLVGGRQGGGVMPDE